MSSICNYHSSAIRNKTRKTAIDLVINGFANEVSFCIESLKAALHCTFLFLAFYSWTLTRNASSMRTLTRQRKLYEDFDQKRKLYEDFDQKRKLYEDFDQKRKLYEDFDQKRKLYEDFDQKRKLYEDFDQKRKLYEELLKEVPMLNTLDEYERMNVADALTSESFPDGHADIQQGKGGGER